MRAGSAFEAAAEQVEAPEAPQEEQQRDGKPVIMEEFGLTSDCTSEANAAHYYRQVLHNTLLAGASGRLAWNTTGYGGL
ncbi:hypothetical protein HCN51_52555 [Nonomuraea sp. FMUSA5-5]|uniref:Uncharacterized protein n=1 Tax=Nonomuraea composti TaxID=2720023 RepID=A0ABX1BJQ9_9ACTN|nr:hypothetical protein [Nonomuraea sp. FMUSA5-5]NJP97965.1 hypothetical protein [Nonomuraea sp. FMUSA5-5]